MLSTGQVVTKVYVSDLFSVGLRRGRRQRTTECKIRRHDHHVSISHDHGGITPLLGDWSRGSAQPTISQFVHRNEQQRASSQAIPANPCNVLIDNRRRRRHLQPISQTDQKCRRSHLRIFFRRNVGSQQKGRHRRNCQDAFAFVPLHVSSGLLQYQQQQQHQSRTEILRPQRRRWWRMTPVGGSSGSPSLSHGVSVLNNDNENPLPPPAATTNETAPACTN